MNVLEKIECQPYGLTIEIDKIQNGWMYIILKTNFSIKKYAASYLCNPIIDLIEKYLLLYENKTCENNPLRANKKYAVIEHDLEGNNIVWLLHKKEDDLYIYIWEDFLEIDNWLWAEFNDQSFINNFENVPQLTENLLFSMKGKMIDFAKTLLPTLDWLKKKRIELDLVDEWGYDFSESDYEKIKTIEKAFR